MNLGRSAGCVHHRDTGAAHGKELSLRSREFSVLQALYFPHTHQISAKRGFDSLPDVIAAVKHAQIYVGDC